MTRKGFVFPLIIITIGVILLLNNLGIISWEIWRTLWLYWPVILILFGIEMLVCCEGSKFTYIASVLISMVLISAVFLLADSGIPHMESAKKLHESDLNGKDLSGWNMNFADLNGANLSFSNLDGANLNFADLENSNISNSDLNGANLNFADLENANLVNSDLSGANLNFAYLNGANMTGARLEGANLFAAWTSETTICADSRSGPCW